MKIEEHDNVTIISHLRKRAVRTVPDLPLHRRFINNFRVLAPIAILLGIILHIGYYELKEQKELKDWEIKRAEQIELIREQKEAFSTEGITFENNIVYGEYEEPSYTIQNFTIDTNDYPEGTSAIEVDDEGIAYNMPTDGDYYFRIYIDDKAITISKEGDHITLDGGNYAN
jgi:hypothetical protein